jgi:hypothetical protein
MFRSLFLSLGLNLSILCRYIPELSNPPIALAVENGLLLFTHCFINSATLFLKTAFAFF